jgi:hypothetical protein
MRCQARGLPGGPDFLPFEAGFVIPCTCHRNYFVRKRNRLNQRDVDYVQNATAPVAGPLRFMGHQREALPKSALRIFTSLTPQQSLRQGFLNSAG